MKLFVIGATALLLAGCQAEKDTEMNATGPGGTDTETSAPATSSGDATAPAAILQPQITAVSNSTLSTKEPKPLTITGKNLSKAQFFLRSGAKEIELKPHTITDTEVVIPDERYEDDKTGVYDVVAKTSDGKEVVLEKAITIGTD